MSPFVAVYLIACLNVADRATCTQIEVTDSTQAQADNAPMTMSGCLGVEGAETARRYWDEHKDMHVRYQFGGWACRIGNKKAPNRGAA